MACPMVSGLAALIMTMRDGMSAQEIRELIEANVRVKAEYATFVSSSGLIDVGATIKALKGDSGISCKRPSGWCSHRGSTYELKDCDRDGIADPVCRDTNGNYGVIQSSKKCSDSWPRGQCQGCERRPGWCTHRGSTFELKDCDRDGIADP